MTQYDKLPSFFQYTTLLRMDQNHLTPMSLPLDLPVNIGARSEFTSVDSLKSCNDSLTHRLSANEFIALLALANAGRLLQKSKFRPAES